MSKLLNEKEKSSIKTAITLSSSGEILARIITPLINMVLARLLAPEHFGIITTINMIVSFVDTIADAGFQKYLVQHEFSTKIERVKSFNVAFWTNLLLSIVIWLMIIIYRNQLSILLGNEGMGNVIAIACVQLPITSFSSIQIAHYRRNLNYKIIFRVRIFSAIVPLIVTIPLAYFGFTYWSLIIGSIVGLLVNALLLNFNAEWKPSLSYSFDILKSMFSFSSWALLDSVTSWLTTWIDVFIIGSTFSAYYLGLYKNSLNMVNSLMSVVTASILPILFASLSRLQKENKKFQSFYYKTQKIVAYLIFPMGVGLFIYRDLATTIMFGDGWEEASDIVGIWSLIMVVGILYSNFNGEAYRAKGIPRISFLYQIIHLFFLIPVLSYTKNLGFWPLVYSRTLIRLQGTITGFIFMKFYMHFSIKEMVGNLKNPFLSTMIMTLFAYIIKPFENSIIQSFINILLCAGVYIMSIRLVSEKDFNEFRNLGINNYNSLKKRKRYNK